jgi:hypothetical protein
MRRVLTLILFILSQLATAQVSIHMEEAAKYRETGYLSVGGYDLLNDFSLTHGKVEAGGDLQKIVFGYHPYWGGSNYLNYQWELLSDLCYFSYDVDPETGGPVSFYGWLTTPAIDSAFAHGVRVHLCVTLFSGHSIFFNNPQSRATLTQNLISLVRQRDAHGVSLDFEAVPASQGPAMLDYIAEFSTALRDSLPGAVLSIAMPAVDWSGIFNVGTLNQYIDLFMIMGYDYYWNGSSQAGPVDPHYSMTSGYDYSVSRSVSVYQSEGMPMEKMLLGVPYYAREWPTASGTAPSAATGYGTAYTWANIRNNAQGHYSPENKKLEPNSFGPYYAYNEGGWHQCFVNDPASLARRYKLVNRRGMAGIGIWALGYDNGYDELWEVIAEQFVQGAGVTACDTLYDSGGPAWDYYDNEDYVLSLYGQEGEGLEISFPEFVLETGYDSLWVYDGPFPGGVLLGGFTGSSLPPVMQTGSWMSLRFRSDHSTHASGWMALVQTIPLSAVEHRDGIDIRIFPNPAAGLLNIRHGLEEQFLVRLYDMRGNMVGGQEYPPGSGSAQIDLSHLPPGVYILTLSCETKAVKRKIVKF